MGAASGMALGKARTWGRRARRKCLNCIVAARVEPDVVSIQIKCDEWGL
jgi:hypothetical protein